jgi:hypothetical protein
MISRSRTDFPVPDSRINVKNKRRTKHINTPAGPVKKTFWPDLTVSSTFCCSFESFMGGFGTSARTASTGGESTAIGAASTACGGCEAAAMGSSEGEDLGNCSITTSSLLGDRGWDKSCGTADADVSMTNGVSLLISGETYSVHLEVASGEN